MRLVCPKCAAQYEVDANAIPEAGRDVQCASCGNTWFQKRVTGLRKEQPAAPPLDPVSKDNVDEDEPRRPARPQAAPADPSVLDILRREAEHDAAVRRGETADFDDAKPADDYEEDYEGRPESEPDISEQDEPAPGIRAPETPERGRRLHLSAGGEDNPASPDASPVPKRPERPARPTGNGPGRPDVDALRSSLRTAIASENVAEDNDYDEFEEDEQDEPGGGSGRFGYYLAIMLCLALVAAYALKAQIVAAVPMAGPWLDQYSALVDIARHGLADAVDRLVVLVRGLITG